MKSYVLTVVVVCVLLLDEQLVCGDDLPTCHPTDFHYEYTECDSGGGRWRVSVPKPGTCVGGAPNPPVRGKDCTFTCSAGQFLDLSGDQSCQPCPAGTYSLGGGVRFDDWEKIPETFTVTSESLESSFLWRAPSGHKSVNCSKSMWKPLGSYLMSLPGGCTTTLTYSTKLVTAGHVTFEYQYKDPETIFHFIVQNDQCQAADDENSSQWPDVTEEGKWGSMSVGLKTGTNILQWRVIGALSEMSGSQNPILIRKIEVTGVAFTSECSKCRNGTYSSGGTAFCAPCDANKYSSRGATQCDSCKANQFSEPGAGSCHTRPPCSKYDYYEYQTPCDKDKRTRKVYDWIQPKVCNEQSPGSVTLPPALPFKPCPPCNSGMHPTDGGADCVFCPDGSHSDGSAPCQPCPVSTSPEYGLDYQWWNVLPPNTTSRCVPMGVGKCSDNSGWQPAGDFVQTSFGPADRNAFLALGLHIGGFRGQPATSEGKLAVLGQVKFTFEINCSHPCEFVFLSDAKGRNNIISSWFGTVERQEFVYDMHTNGALTLSWAFQPISYNMMEEEGDYEEGMPEVGGGGGPVAGGKKSSKHRSTLGLDNTAKIHSVKVTNTLGGGATHCLACPKGMSEKGCVPCPDGQFIEQQTSECVDCPPDTVLPSSNSWGQQACKACGEGLKAVDRRICKSDCQFTDKAGRLYDFTALDGVHYVQGGRLFTSSGTMYYHGFNLTLCNIHNAQLPVCINNVTVDAEKKNHSSSEEAELISRNNVLNMPNQVSGMVCRSTLIPQADKDKPLVSTQPVSLATHLTKIISNVSLTDMYKAGGFDVEGSELDVHFYYKSDAPTMACPEGRTTIISLRCDPDEKVNNSIQLPPQCSDGTCDGCTFHFLWLTQHACPRCQREDYDVIRGECVSGEQLIHYYPPKFCLPLDDKDMKPMKQKCQTLPFVVMVSIPVALGVGLILILLLIYCWSRNKKLEYKYCKLVESAGGRDGELPGVESCGMEEGEEDESVHFSHNKGPKLLQKIRLKISGVKNKDDDNPFVAVRLHEKQPLT